jgi:hypothetical protein
MKAENRFWSKWILHFSYGDLIGITITSIVARLLLVGLSRTSISNNATMAYAILIIAALTEGLIIGYAQWKSLSALVTDFREQSWLLTTASATIIAWLLILVPVVMVIPMLSGFALMNVYYLSLTILLAGAAFGTIIGIAQFFILKKYYRNAMTWILANALGWAISFLTIFTAWSIFSIDHPYLINALLIIASCIVSGFVQGVVTGMCLHTAMSLRKAAIGHSVRPWNY